MQEPANPDDEDQRLAALRSLGLLDTPPEQRFNRITRTAARLFRAPIALVSLVDDKRQWFKSRYGLFVAETPRNISFCGHAILGDEIFVIEDARKDERFHDNPLVTGPPHIRFYAGRPLATASGSKLGTLCIIDREPRLLSEEDRLTLDDLATWAEREINLRIELAGIQARLAAVLENVADGAILFGPDARIQWTNASLIQLLGHAAEDLRGADLATIVEADSLPAVKTMLAALQPGAEGAAGSMDAMLRHKDGKTLLLKLTLVAWVVDDTRFVTAVVNRP